MDRVSQPARTGRTNHLRRLIWERFAHPDAPADTALGLAERFEVDEEAALAALNALVEEGRLESLVVGRLVVFCRTGRRPSSTVGTSRSRPSGAARQPPPPPRPV
jgi:hypothetical protein